MAVLFIGYPKCSTCQKAEKWLKENKIDYIFRNIKEDNPGLEELKEWYNISGMDIKRFFNTSGLIYKEMKLKDKISEMTLEEKLKLLASDGMLVKRPLVIGDDYVLVGYKEAEWDEDLKSL